MITIVPSMSAHFSEGITKLIHKVYHALYIWGKSLYFGHFLLMMPIIMGFLLKKAYFNMYDPGQQ